MNKYNVSKILIVFLTGLFFALAGSKALAITEEITITCNPGDEGPNNCAVLPSNTAPLFDENDYPLFDLKPGDEIHREITVTNNREETCYFTLTDATKTHDTETPPTSGNYFSDRLETEITDGVDTTGLISFATLFGLTDIYLAELAPFETKTLDWDVFFDKNAGNEYQNARLVFDFTWNFNCGEEPPQTELFIEKTNNKIGITQLPGADVTYTIFVTASQFYPVFNVIVLDLPPGGFTYTPGSWTANSSVRGNIKGLGTTTEPSYTSPGLWNLGDMEAGEVVTLTYVTNISSSQQPGLYKDIAWTEGTATSDPTSTRVLGNAGTGFFVGTSAAVDIEDPKEVQVEPEIEIIKIEEGEVLGAEILPATGANNIWVFIISNLFGIGVILTIIGLYLKRHRKGARTALQIFVFLAAAALTFSANAFATDLLIRLAEPASPNNLNELDLNFVAMDVENRAVTVKCFKKGPSEAAFSQFGSSTITIPGGDTGYCDVTSSVLSGMGTYKFYATADAGGDNSTSQTVTIEHDDERPGKPHNLDKDKNGSCKYDISFTTDSDGGDTVRVEVYRSDDKEFYVNDSTKIKDIVVGSDTDVSFTDDRPTCGKTYYYAVAAFDAAGNRSKILVEELEKEKIIIKTTKETEITSVFGEITEAIALGEGAITTPEEEDTEEVIEEEELSVEKEKEEKVLGLQEVSEEEGAFSELLKILKWPVLVLLVLIILLYVRKKLKR